MFFLIVIGLPAIFFLEIRQKFSSRGVQTAFRVYRGRVWAENFFGKKNNFLLMFVTLETKNWEFWQKHVCSVVRTAFYVFRGMVWRFSVFLKRIIFLSAVVQWPENFLAVWQKKRQQGCQNCILCVQRNGLKIFTFFETNKFFKRCCTMTAKIFGCLAKKTSAGLSKLNSMCPEERWTIFSGKTCSFFLTFMDF